MKKSENILTNLSILFCVVVLISILLLNINTFYWADDYAFMNEIKKNGILKNCIAGYFNWDGRFLTVPAFFQAFLLKNVKIEFITLIWNFCFLISGFLTFVIAKNQLNLKLSNKNLVLLGLTTAIFIWFGSKTFLAQTIYWGTGGAYSFSLLIGFLWIVFYQKSQKSKINLKNNILLFIFTFIASATTQNFSIGFVTLIIFDLVIDFLNKDFDQLKFKFLLLLISISGILFLLIAPGNLLRMKEIYNLDISALTFNDLINNFNDVFLRYYKSCEDLILMSLISGIIFRTFCYDGFINLFKIKFHFANKKDFFNDFLNNSKWFFVAISTIMPFIFMPMMAVQRTIIYFAFFSVIFIYCILLKNYKVQSFQFDLKKIIAFPILIFTIGFSFNFSIQNMKKGLILKQEILKREEILKNSENQEITVTIIPKDLLSPCYMFSDFQMDLPEDNFFIEGPRIYYNTNKISVKEQN